MDGQPAVKGIVYGVDENMSDEQPDWTQAPAWANFWTRDVGGVTMWWETKPFYDGRIGAWMCEDESLRARGLDLPLLRQRPQSALAKSEQWQPLENGKHNRIAGRTSIEIRADMVILENSDSILTAALPDDIRLCRRKSPG